MFNGSYIKVILDIAETDPHCKLSFVKSDLENARKELAGLQSRPTKRAVDGAYWLCKNGHQNHDMGTRFCWACDAPRN